MVSKQDLADVHVLCCLLSTSQEPNLPLTGCLLLLSITGHHYELSASWSTEKRWAAAKSEKQVEKSCGSNTHAVTTGDASSHPARVTLTCHK